MTLFQSMHPLPPARRKLIRLAFCVLLITYTLLCESLPGTAEFHVYVDPGSTVPDPNA